MAFFYNPPDDYQIYHITCEFLNDINNNESLSDHTFYYKLDDKNLYKITCILISHSLIVQFLNKKMYGIELKQGDEQQQEFLTFSNYERKYIFLPLWVTVHFAESHFAEKDVSPKNRANIMQNYK
ncbi:hypothetical protein RhiirA5_503690 [Rhizophagus irregularis]|uniref:Uncharacterized protein n=1 Tax=Rhizophagus irregularis TaxID=588596 RepID=A0A2N0P877_9GLOM|nr:hypothetical protein RhiirA5_503690 [Rhizophagus irregularis]